MAVTGKLPRYRYISRLGAGGMATVELAEDTVLDRLVALKRMHAAAEGQGVSRLRREALVGASISHPNLVGIYDVVTTEDGEVVIVMEYVEGETLAARLDREQRLGAKETLRVLAEVAAALDAIHDRGIVHRDVKPANILLGQDGRVKLADLGVAAAPDRTRITTAGAMVGSFRYMAPEQLEDGPVTPAIDVYALAAVAFEMLSGRQAHKAPNPLALAHAISTQPPPDLREAWAGAPEDAARVLMMGMSRDPRDRPRSAGDLVRRLRAALEPAPTVPLQPRERMAAVGAPVPLSFDRGRRGRVLPVLLGLVALAVALVVILASSGGSTHGRPAASRVGHRRHHHAAATGSGAAASGSTSTTSAAGGSTSGAGGSTSGAGGSTSGASGGSTSAAGGSTSGASGGSTSTTGAGASTTGASTSSPAQPTSTPATGNATPVAATESFYRFAAAHQYPAAWALADPAFRNQLQGYDSFVAGQAADRSITFRSARVVSQSPGAATVMVKTLSVRADGSESCSGSVALVPSSSGGWLLDRIDINCTPA